MSFYLAFTLTSRFTEGKESDTEGNVKILAMIIAAALLSSFCGKIISTKIFMTISKRLHDATVKSLLASHIKFFEQHTHGHILNRFTSDIKTLDNFVF
jgi:ABC-type multidrug transport system fused ATPase/permease subunit